MLDLLALAIGLGLFAISIEYALACDRLRGASMSLDDSACRFGDRGAAH